jgi:hypothetical protein
VTKTSGFLLPVLAAVLVLGGIAALAWAGSRGQTSPAGEEYPVSVPTLISEHKPSTPSVDPAAPSELETATFALG